MKVPSMRGKLLIRCGIGVGALLCMLSIGIYLTVRHGLYREIDQSIQQTAALLSNEVELENGKISFEWQEGMGTNSALIDEGLFQFWNETTGETSRSPGMQSRDLPKFCGPDGKPLMQDIVLPGRQRHARAIGMRIYPFVIPEEAERMKASGRIIDPKSLPHILVVARDAKPIHRVLTRLRWILTIGTLLTLAIGFFMIDRAVRLSLRPIDRLTDQVRDRTDHQLDSALELPGELPSELGGLAKNFDSLLARVAATRRRERDFIRHAAHELRTPIAGLQATADLALSKPRENADYAAYLHTCRQAALELGELVKRLSSLARLGNTGPAAVLEILHPDNLLDECLEVFTPVLNRRGLVVSRTRCGSDAAALGDPTLVRIIINNLLDNAASHAEEGAVISIRCAKREERVDLSVSNPARDLPEDLDRLFEPLFRQSRPGHGTDSHLGIGLTLSQEAAHATGGSLLARRTEENQIEFTFSLPASPP